MNTLILRPSLQNLEYAIFQDADRHPLWTGCISDYRNADNGRNALLEIKQQGEEHLELWQDEGVLGALPCGSLSAGRISESQLLLAMW